MKKEELIKKYGKKLINKILKEGYLDGCTISINKDGSENIQESDIKIAIREINGEEIEPYEWD